MSERPTPETDAEIDREMTSACYPRLYVSGEFARKLERERDEAREARKASAADWLTQVEQANDRVSRALQQVAFAEKERDEARDQRDIALLEVEEISQELADIAFYLSVGMGD